MLVAKIALFGGLVAIPAAFLMLRRNKYSASRAAAAGDRPTSAPNPSAQPAHDVHAVSIQTGHFPCEAARQLRGERFLAAEAPTLPVIGCDKSDCQCRYRHHSDRRHHGERRLPFPTLAGFDPCQQHGERRKPHDRRKSE